MDYSLLLGIHDVARGERDDEDAEEPCCEDDADPENGLAPAAQVGSYGTSPEGIAGYMNSFKPLGPGEFDPYVDVYAVKSATGKFWPVKPSLCQACMEEGNGKGCYMCTCVVFQERHTGRCISWASLTC